MENIAHDDHHDKDDKYANNRLYDGQLGHNSVRHTYQVAARNVDRHKPRAAADWQNEQGMRPVFTVIAATHFCCFTLA